MLLSRSCLAIQREIARFSKHIVDYISSGVHDRQHLDVQRACAAFESPLVPVLFVSCGSQEHYEVESSQELLVESSIVLLVGISGESCNSFPVGR